MHGWHAYKKESLLALRRVRSARSMVSADLGGNAGDKVLVMGDEHERARVGLQAGHKAAYRLHVQVCSRLILHTDHPAIHNRI